METRHRERLGGNREEVRASAGRWCLRPLHRRAAGGQKTCRHLNLEPSLKRRIKSFLHLAYKSLDAKPIGIISYSPFMLRNACTEQYSCNLMLAHIALQRVRNTQFH